MVLVNITQFVEEMIKGKTDYVIIKDGKKPLQIGDTIRIFYNVHMRKSCENCIVRYLDVEYDDVPVNCPRAGVCKRFTNFIGSGRITGTKHFVDGFNDVSFDKGDDWNGNIKQLAAVQGITLGTKLRVEQEGTHGIRLTKE